ncbi:hypothetical protein [Actinocatenispora sera]|uniref:Uncharacterized protein n=1 Tax=Actinocatenispora sera TaxID=390989 RepID=A0A810LB12_9ACTN|nr:hypothetical protein [Actinocatenispora sera]BCJ32457.1 hypothetical protein Asera_65650 [Actinocatenispora sera]
MTASFARGGDAAGTAPGGRPGRAARTVVGATGSGPVATGTASAEVPA